MYIHINNGEQNVTLSFKVTGKGHSSTHLSYDTSEVLGRGKNDFDVYTNIINHWTQKMTMTFNFKVQDYSANAI